MAANRRVRRPKKTVRRTFTEWLPYWHNELNARDLRRASFRMYDQGIRAAVNFFGDVPPESVTADDVDAWKAALLKRGLQASTINAYLLRLGTFYNWLTDEKLIDVESPVLSVSFISQRDQDNLPPVFDSATVARIVKAAKRPVVQGRDAFTCLRDETLVSFLCDTGMRASECARVGVDDVNLAARQVRLRAEVTKGRYERVVTFGFHTSRLLTRYLNERRNHRLTFLPELFITLQGAMTYETVYRVVRDAGRAAGVIGARPHLLRHTWAHDMKSQGVDSEVLMSLAGWRNPAMAAMYGRAARQERAVAAYQRVGAPVDRAGVKTAARGTGRRDKSQERSA